jgi:ferredoxin-NADP reductase
MAGTAVRGRLTWQAATVGAAAWETPSVRTIGLDVPDWTGHRAGQHLDLRLTAEDGYVAERAYSIGSAPGEPVSITVERLADGEVSPYLTDELRPGDELEVRGPIGGYFVWDPADGRPLLMLAGGSGIVPLRSILRSRDQAGSMVPVRLLYSARSLPEVIYRAELDAYRASPRVEVSYALTRQQPDGWTGIAGRVGEAVLSEIAWPPGDEAMVFVCGPTAFVEVVAAIMVKLGYPPQRVKTERFGGTETQ